MKLSSIFIISILLASCLNVTESDHEQQARTIIDKAIEHHGTMGSYSFNFRGDAFAFSITDTHFVYKKTIINEIDTVQDILTNDQFTRVINGKPTELTSKEVDKYKESLNSVIYFVNLPQKLADPAVNANYLRLDTINQQPYHLIEVTFNAENGGEDHEDVFRYWFSTSNVEMEYLAYKYHTNEGGIRFRKAINKRVINNRIFQDFINYGAPLTTALDSLGILFENNQLEQLSLIELTNIQPLP